MGDFNKNESESLVFIGLEIPRDYILIERGGIVLKKKMKLLVYLLFVLMLVIVNFFNKSNGTKEKKMNLSIDVKPISEVSESAVSDMQKAKESSVHLKFSEIIPYCPNVSSIAGIHYYRGKNYKDISNEKDMLGQQISFLQNVFGKDISQFKKDCFESDYYGLIEKGDYSSFEEFLNDNAENEAREPGYLAYVDQDEKHLEAFSVQNDFLELFLIKGKCYELSYENRMNEKDGLTTLTQPRFVCEKVADYYVYENNSRLDDKWKLADGEISVKDGIKFAEKYIDDMVRLDGENSNVKLKIAYVEVYKINDSTYCFRYRIRRSIGDVFLQTINNGDSLGAPNLDYDLADAYQIERENIDMYIGPTKICDCTQENESSSILPLSKAIEILEMNLGDNSKYLVKAVELGYLSLVDDANKQDEGHATVCWYFYCINEQDNWITEFYINALTGEINTYARHD